MYQLQFMTTSSLYVTSIYLWLKFSPKFSSYFSRYHTSHPRTGHSNWTLHFVQSSTKKGSTYALRSKDSTEKSQNQGYANFLLFYCKVQNYIPLKNTTFHTRLISKNIYNQILASREQPYLETDNISRTNIVSHVGAQDDVGSHSTGYSF